MAIRSKVLKGRLVQALAVATRGKAYGHRTTRNPATPIPQRVTLTPPPNSSTPDSLSPTHTSGRSATVVDGTILGTALTICPGIMAKDGATAGGVTNE